MKTEKKNINVSHDGFLEFVSKTCKLVYTEGNLIALVELTEISVIM